MGQRTRTEPIAQNSHATMGDFYHLSIDTGAILEAWAGPPAYKLSKHIAQPEAFQLTFPSAAGRLTAPSANDM